MHLPESAQHRGNELDLVLDRFDLDLVVRLSQILLILNDLQLPDLQVFLQFVQLVVILLEQTEELPVVILSEVEVLVPFGQSVL